MKNLIAFLIFILGAKLSAAQTTSVVSGKTSFSIRYWAGTCEGSFDAPKGKVNFNPQNLAASSIDISVPAASFESGNNTRDKDIKGKKYLHAAAHPQIRFVSNKISVKGDTYYAAGTMTIKGASKQMSIPFKASRRADGGYDIKSNFTINRLDHQVGEITRTMKDIVTVNVSAIVK
jgi:polyisoprenoid-binding protein YceI